MLSFMYARGAAAFVFVAAIVAGSDARAQPVRPLLPVAGDTLMKPDPRDVFALQPLRLGLMSGAIPHPFGTPGCEPGGLATGLSPLPNQTIAANHLRLGSSARITLFGFARDGCALDQAIGGGFALTVPIAQNVMFMWGGGAIYLPHGGPNGKPLDGLGTQAGVVWQGKNGRSYTVGIATKLGGPHVSFAGTF